MKALYKYQGHSIGKFPCVSLDANDKLLVGLKGWLWLANNAGTRVGMAYHWPRKWPKITYHDIAELPALVLRIKRFGSLTQQAKYANNPELRSPRV